jgi:hypothetical protein
MTAAITATSAMALAMSAIVVRRLIPQAFVGVGGGGCGGGAGLAGASDSAIRALGLAVLPAASVGGTPAQSLGGSGESVSVAELGR